MKVVIIGIDGATWTLLDPWIKDNTLPTIKKFMEKGTYGILESTLPPTTVPAWPCMYTGVSPQKLRIFDFQKVDFNSNRMRLISSLDIKYPTLWDIIGKHNKKSIVMNVPLTYPPRNINGLIITGMETPKGKEFTYPRNLKERLPKNYIIEPSLSRDPDPKKRKEKNIKTIYEYTKQHFEVVKNLMRNEDWDFFFFVIRGTDIIQHLFWKDKKLLKDYYKFIDKNLADIVKICARDTNFIIVSDHGFGDYIGIDFNINYWLQKEGFLKIKKSLHKSILENLRNYGISWEKITSVAEQFLLREFFRKLLPSNKIKKIIPKEDSLNFEFINLEKSKAVAWGGIYIISRNNIDSIKNKIIEKAKNIKGPNGEKLDIKIEVIDNNDPETPEIYIILNKYGINNSLFRKELWSKNPEAYNFEGNHRKDGIFILSGPDIKASGEIERRSIIDITPTVLSLFNIPIPDYMEGSVIYKALYNWEEKRYRTNIFIEEEKNYNIFNKKEEEEIKGRLRDLGYI